MCLHLLLKKGLATIKFHNKKVNVLKGAVPSKTMVCKWALEFQSDCMSTEDDIQSGHSKIALPPEINNKISYNC